MILEQVTIERRQVLFSAIQFHEGVSRSSSAVRKFCMDGKHEDYDEEVNQVFTYDESKIPYFTGVNIFIQGKRLRDNDWVVRVEDGRLKTYSDEAFRLKFRITQGLDTMSVDEAVKMFVNNPIFRDKIEEELMKGERATTDKRKGF